MPRRIHPLSVLMQATSTIDDERLASNEVTVWANKERDRPRQVSR